jgi:hypothetical protein
MAGSFDVQMFSQLDTFYYRWNDPEHEFLDPQLDSKRKQLHDLIKEYYKSICHNTFPNSSGKQEIPPEWEYEKPAEYQAAII